MFSDIANYFHLAMIIFMMSDMFFSFATFLSSQSSIELSMHKYSFSRTHC